MSNFCRGMSALFALLVVLSVTQYAHAQAQPTKPNLVLILSDDQGYADVGFNGCKDIPTPNLDRIAKEGARVTNGYVTYPVCGPSRAGLMTGRYQDRFGYTTNPAINPNDPRCGLPLTEKNIAELLKPAGYTSMIVGKWHLGTHPTLRPLVRGFDEFYGFLSGGHRYLHEELTLNDLSEVKKPFDWYRTKLLQNEERIQIDDYLTDVLSDAGADFIKRRHKDGPFFLYLAYNAPHGPLQATKKYLDRFPDLQGKRKTYAAMVSAMDDGVGRILDTLDELKLAENTIVVFLSDNGGATKNASSNLPLRGHKSTLFEGGVRVPFAIRWTGTIPADQTYKKPVSSMDIAATIVAHAGAKVDPNKPLDGVDLLPYLTGKNKNAAHPVLYWRMEPKDRLAILKDGMKVILSGDEGSLMFNLKDDITEKKNLYTTRPEEFEALEAEVREWSKDFPGPAFPALESWP
ncbi:MAG: sulfatase-like hydrolase/transferase [Phycisphaeraceae bacterium]